MKTMMQTASWYSKAALLPAKKFEDMGTTLVVAPHQDDESLGCGGTIALLRQAGVSVHVVFVSDGSMSHPNSKKYPKNKLVALRETESIAALKVLGVDADAITFLHLPDGRLPHIFDAAFAHAVKAMEKVFQKVNPKTVLVPWRRDPHRDHQATWEMTREAIAKMPVKAKKLEYFVWLWERAGSNDLPLPGEGKVWKIDIKHMLDVKHKAVAAHVSQTTNMIDDDPEGFTLSTNMLHHFDEPIEIFIEVD